MANEFLKEELEKTVKERRVLEKLQERTMAKITECLEKEAALKKLIAPKSSNGKPDEFEQIFSQLQNQAPDFTDEDFDDSDDGESTGQRRARPPSQTKTFAILYAMLEARNPGLEIPGISALIEKKSGSQGIDERGIYNIFNKQIHRTERIQRKGDLYFVTQKGIDWVKRISGRNDFDLGNGEKAETENEEFREVPVQNRL